MVKSQNQSMSMTSLGHSEWDFQKIWMSGGKRGCNFCKKGAIWPSLGMNYQDLSDCI